MPKSCERKLNSCIDRFAFCDFSMRTNRLFPQRLTASLVSVQRTPSQTEARVSQSHQPFQI